MVACRTIRGHRDRSRGPAKAPCPRAQSPEVSRIDAPGPFLGEDPMSGDQFIRIIELNCLPIQQLSDFDCLADQMGGDGVASPLPAYQRVLRNPSVLERNREGKVEPAAGG